jgi:hypothetical protein
MLPFVPGMLGSRKKGDELRDIYSGQEQVPIRAGRWWEVGSTAFEGARIRVSPLEHSSQKSCRRRCSLWTRRREVEAQPDSAFETREYPRLPLFATFAIHYRQQGIFKPK